MKSVFESFSPEELQEILNKSNSLREVLYHVGLSDIGNNYRTLRKYIEKYNLSTDIVDKNRRKNSFGKKTYSKDTFINDLDNGRVTCKGSEILKKLIDFGLKEYKCEKCGIDSWMGESLTLELHHKDGNHKNNKYINLEIVCPNCHSQTNNFRYKNNTSIKSDVVAKNCTICGKIISNSKTKLCFECYTKQRRNNTTDSHKKILCPACKKKFINKESKTCFSCYNRQRIHVPKIPREEIKEQIRKYSFKEVSIMYKVDVKTVRRWCNQYDLPTNKKIINKYSDTEWAFV